MRVPQFSIAAIMGTVLVAAVGLAALRNAAVGLAALRNASAAWAGGMLMLTCGCLALAVVGVLCGERGGRAWWLGFAAFGGTYMAVSRCWSSTNLTRLPTTFVLEELSPKVGVPLRPTPWSCTGLCLDQSFEQAGQCLWMLLAAVLGGLMCHRLFARAVAPAVRDETAATVTNPPARDRWLQGTIAAISGLILLTSMAAFWLRSAVGFWGGATFRLTGVLIGLAALFAVFRQGRQRAIGLGAAILAAGCLMPLGIQPAGSTGFPDKLLEVVRPWLPPMARSMDSANARILEALDRPISMGFRDETPLGELLNSIRGATATLQDPGLQIYVDPVGLQEAERSLNSTVQIDLEGIPLKTTLALCLEQLGLAYYVKDGYLRITNEDRVALDCDDPFLIVGHCLLALLAAGIGAIIAPLVADPRRAAAGTPFNPGGA